jgi:Ni/Co efflux regulator RcnB
MKKLLLAVTVSLLMSAPTMANDSAEAQSSQGKHSSHQEENKDLQHDHRESQGYPSKEEMSHDMSAMKTEKKDHEQKEVRQ